MTSSDFSDLKGVEAANPQLGEIITLPDFLATAGALTPAQRKIIVGQAADAHRRYLCAPAAQTRYARGRSGAAVKATTT